MRAPLRFAPLRDLVKYHRKLMVPGLMENWFDGAKELSQQRVGAQPPACYEEQHTYHYWLPCHPFITYTVRHSLSNSACARRKYTSTRHSSAHTPTYTTSVHHIYREAQALPLEQCVCMKETYLYTSFKRPNPYPLFPLLYSFKTNLNSIIERTSSEYTLQNRLKLWKKL